MNLSQSFSAGTQLKLFHEVHLDDQFLLNAIDGEWFAILHSFPWENYRTHAAAYYDALYAFNIENNKDKIQRNGTNDETKEQARQRLLFERTTMQNSEESKIIFHNNSVEHIPTVHPSEIEPGVVPNRSMGRKPKCFFSLLKAFIGVTLMGCASEPEQVYFQLNNNPSFSRVCGFAMKNNSLPDNYQQVDVPSLRKLEQFDQIMRQAGIWEKIKQSEINTNFKLGVFQAETQWVGDTTHYLAYSGFETVQYEDENGKVKKKSQSRVTKNCGCKNKQNCHHEWQLTDDGAGTIVKSTTKMYWGHKASVIGLPKQGVVIDAAAVMDSATHDGKTFFPHVEKCLEQYPEIAASVYQVLYDSACDDKDLREKFKRELGLELKASFNPRGAKSIIENLPKGIDRVTPRGVPICLADHEMDYQGIRYDSEKFIFRAPSDENGDSVCIGCSQREACCNRSDNNKSSRTVTIPFDVLPNINSEDPPMAKRFKALMANRPSVERMIKRLKCDFGDSRLTKRGNFSFQAYLDKTVIGYHLLLRYLD